MSPGFYRECTLFGQYNIHFFFLGMYTLHLGCPNQNELTLLNTWDINKDYQALNQSIQAKKKCPHIFQGAHLTISCRGLPPFNIWKPDGSVYGVDVDLIQILSQAFGFSYDIVTESVMGSLIPNSKNQWLGVVGSVGLFLNFFMLNSFKL